MRPRHLSAFVLAALCSIVTVSGQGPREEVEGYLHAAGFNAAQVDRLDAGEVLVRVESGDPTDEILATGAVKIHASREQVLSYYGQMITYVDGKVTLALGRFSTPPVAADVEGLAFDRDEVETLRACRPGDCDIRLGGASLSALRSSVRWEAPDVIDQVNRYFRQAAVTYVRDYQSRGDAALVTYDDRSRQVSLRAEWAGILAHSPLLHQYAPELADYLANYPSRALPGGRDVFYWAREDYGLKPIMSLVHGVIYLPPGSPDRIFIAQKQLYASHYYDGSLAVGTVLGATENGAAVSYLLYANRSRGDLLKGGFGGLRRTVARRQAESAARDTLGTIKDVLERNP